MFPRHKFPAVQRENREMSLSIILFLFLFSGNFEPRYSYKLYSYKRSSVYSAPRVKLQPLCSVTTRFISTGTFPLPLWRHLSFINHLVVSVVCHVLFLWFNRSALHQRFERNQAGRREEKNSAEEWSRFGHGGRDGSHMKWKRFFFHVSRFVQPFFFNL